MAFPPFRGIGTHSAPCPPGAMQWRAAGAFLNLGSARVGGDGLIDEGSQRLRLILLGDGTHDIYAFSMLCAE